MKWYRKAFGAIAVEGFAGALRRRFVRRSVDEAESNLILRQRHEELASTFRHKTKDMKTTDLQDYFWYHTIDLGQGLITPGAYDYRDVVPAFHFPENMAGMSVLDVGSATGFFAFEFERRGASVVSVELPSFKDWDRFPGETVEQMLHKFRKSLIDHGLHSPERVDELISNSTADDLHRILLDGPYQFCHDALGSSVERRYTRLYDLSAETVGSDKFDLVFLGDVLLHTVNPLFALAAAASVCSGKLVLSQAMPILLDPRPAVLYVGGDVLGQDDVIWWLPNAVCLEQLLRKLGFGHVRCVDSYTGTVKATGHQYDRSVFHATRE